MNSTHNRTGRRNALITGGTRGIGGAIARRLARSGYNCTITGTAEVPAAGVSKSFTYLKADFRDREDVEKIAAYLAKESVSVLVNNVGLNIKGPTVNFAKDDYDLLLDANLRAPFRLIQSALPHMLEESFGRIVNIASLWSLSGNHEDGAYCASKFGIDGLTASVAAEVASHNVLINAVSPGFIYTEAAEEAYTPQELEQVSAMIPVGRLGSPDEVASLVSWLVSEENSYLTGQNILIDGGLTRTAK